MLAPPAAGRYAIESSVVLFGGDRDDRRSFASKLACDLAARDGAARRVPVWGRWELLEDVSGVQ